MAEYDEQCAVVEYCDIQAIPCVHIPNEGKRSPVTAERLKRAGMRPGFPDLLIPVARGKYHSLYIEMKAEGGKPTKEQAEWVMKLRDAGMAAWVCVGAENGIACVKWYMEQ